MTMHEFSRLLEDARENGGLFEALERIRLCEPAAFGLDFDELTPDRRGWSQVWEAPAAPRLDPEGEG